ncbi:hypothetical protein [Cellulomonas sp. URHB0016]
MPDPDARHADVHVDDLTPDLLGERAPERVVALPPHPEPATGDAPRVRRIGRVQLVASIVVLALLAGWGAWAGWRHWRGAPASLEVDGVPISNAEAVLAGAEQAFGGLVETDGGTVPDGAGCWFAPRADDSATDAPRVACGPVLVGIAGDTERWVVGTPSFGAAPDVGSGPRVTGTFDGFRGTADLRPGLLRRPDGARPPTGQPTLGTEVVRDQQGRVVSGLGPLIDSADLRLSAATTAAGAAVTDSTRCYVGVREVRRAKVVTRVSDSMLLCGPVLLTSSAPGALWVSVPFSTTAGDTIVEADVTDVTLTAVTSTALLPEGVSLYRPDGAEPPADADELEPPDAEPVDPGTVTVLPRLPEVPDGVDLVPPPDDTNARLITPALAVELTGLARVPQLGKGREAVVAPPGEELVVARLGLRTLDEDAPGRGTATVVVDGARLPVRDWNDAADGGALVVSVPVGAQAVGLEVLWQERTQAVSLLTGVRAPGFPAALYRARTSAGVGAPASVTLPLPVGKPARAGGAVAEISLDAWSSADGWAPVGQAFLSVAVDDWAVDSPCCEMRDLKLTSRWVVVLPDGTTLPADSGPSARPESLRFTVPETISAATLRLEAEATWSTDAGPAAASGVADVPIEAPQ